MFQFVFSQLFTVHFMLSTFLLFAGAHTPDEHSAAVQQHDFNVHVSAARSHRPQAGVVRSAHPGWLQFFYARNAVSS